MPSPTLESPSQLWTARIVDFLREIGLEVTLEDTQPQNSFLPKVRVVKGTLVVSPGVFPGDILHEAGHVATIPKPFRHLADGNLSAVFKAMGEYVEVNPPEFSAYQEDPIARGIMQCSDPEATAWQYAAAHAIGLPDKWLFPKHAYDGEAKGILMSLKATRYLGINGLQAAGWTVTRANPHRPLPVYPKLVQWLHPGAGV